MRVGVRAVAFLALVLTCGVLGAGSAIGQLEPPDTTIGSGPSGTVASSSAEFAFSSTQDPSTFECQLDGGGFSPCTSPAAFSGLAEGAHTFDVRATNIEALTDATPASSAWTVDTVAPETTIGSAPSGTVGSSAATFVFSSDDTGATFQCSVDSGTFTGCSSPATYTVADGPHTFAVRAVDGAGNADSSPAPASWSVDASAPGVAITGGPSGTVSSSSATFQFSSEAGSTLECRLDAAAFTSCASPASYSSLGDGGHTFDVRATDGVGNVGSASASWTVDTTTPDTAIASGPTGTHASRSVTIVFSAEPAATFECRLDGAAFGACSSPATYAELTNGPHSFEVRARDAAGNVDGTPASAQWTVDTMGPMLDAPNRIVAEAVSAAGAPVSFTVSGSENGEGVLPDAISCSPRSGAVFPLGRTVVTCTSSDRVGNTSTHSLEVVVQDSTPPLSRPPGDLVIVATSAAGIETSHAAIVSFVARASAVDLVDPRPKVNVQLPPVLALGTTQVTFASIDSAGNQGTATTKVTVVDLVPGRQAGQVVSLGPDRLGPPDAVVQAKPGAGYALLTWANPRVPTFDHVDIFRSRVDETARTTQAVNQTLVYRGKGTSFKDRRVNGGVQYRYTVVSIDKTGNRSLGAVTVVEPQRSFLRSPREGATFSKPPVLRWARANGARYVNVQIYRGKTKVLSTWPRSTSLKLASTWRYGGKVQRLVPGVYRWYVWPGLGSPAASRYGPLMGERTFVVRKGKTVTR